MLVQIGFVVEGHGETESVPCLLRRIAQAFDPSLEVVIPRPIRVTKSRLLQPGELERKAQMAALNTGNRGGILVVLDSDDDCPAQLGPQLLRRVRSARCDLPSAVVLAQKEFESWFIAAAESLRGKRGLPTDLESPEQPEQIAGAKEWLTKRIAHGRVYAPTVDQASLTSALDLKLARRAASFDKCYRDVIRLLEELRSLIFPRS
ncbi:MAG: DUF4276 family protein [Acidobacteriota bacterium]